MNLPKLDEYFAAAERGEETRIKRISLFHDVCQMAEEAKYGGRTPLSPPKVSCQN